MLLMMQQNIKAQDSTGTERAMDLTGNVTAIMARGVVMEDEERTLSEEEAAQLEQTGRLEIERQGFVADVRSSLRDCGREDREHAVTRSGFHVDIELRAYIVNGFDDNGIRTDYSDARFGINARGFSEIYGGRIRGLSISQAADLLAADPELRITRANAYQFVLRERLINATSEERIALLRQAGHDLNFDEQVQFVARLGYDMAQRYDHDRAAESVGAREIPDCNAMLGNLASTSDIGVCRDIHMCMAHVMRQMGNQGNVYGLSYATPGNYHVSLVATDPRNPNRVHNINYDTINVANDRIGAAALAQDHDIPDVGISYRLWRPDGQGGGEMVASVPSQMGLVLNEVTGGNNVRTYDQNTTSDYSLASVGTSYGPWGLRAFASQLANGDQVLGVATDVRWGDSPESGGRVFNGLSQDGSIGLAFAHREMTRPRFNEPTQLDINMIYMNFQQRVGIPVHIDNVTIEPELGLVIQGTGIEGGFADSRGWTGDGNVTLDGSVRAEYVSTDEHTRVQARVGTQATLGLRDIRGLFGSDAIVVFNHTYVELTTEQQLDDNARLNTALLYVMREYGDTFSATAGVEIDSEIGTSAINMGILTPAGSSHGFVAGGAHPALIIGASQIFDIDRNAGTSFEIGADWRQQLDDGQYMFNSSASFHF